MLSRVSSQLTVAGGRRAISRVTDSRSLSRTPLMRVQTRASSSQTLNGVKILYDDHKHFRDLFSRYEGSSKSGKIGVVRELVKDISAHSSAEQRYLYPLIASKLGRDDLEDRNYLDEKVNQIVLDWVDKHTPANDQEWEVYDDTVHKLKVTLLEHMGEEEKFVLQPLDKVLSSEDKKHLYDNISWAKKNAPTHPHPESPMRPPVSTVMQPVVSQLDKAGDAIFGDKQG